MKQNIQTAVCTAGRVCGASHTRGFGRLMESVMRQRTLQLPED
ncbi:TPA: hypothetical protein ACFNMI_000525 [Neisseria bacilliformis]|uniref:Uncharacterized protein n=1 Tax=Neisseria bacilliformis ATCC BAA-1200 TaxID=888742 RepID=F2BE79_9NEIS|nr:hypothetical protein [Neisseria bacilliformis]EGF10398.1 hypothetical protein HMPREF9123_2035 [Neisseria bacilliformis ATCC BAA-1200]